MDTCDSCGERSNNLRLFSGRQSNGEEVDVWIGLDCCLDTGENDDPS